MVHANSHQAYEVSKVVAPTRKEQILKVINKYPGKTSMWIASYLKIELHKISGRFTQLRDAGIIVSIGDLKIGKTTFQQYVIKQAEPKQLNIF